MRLGDGRGGFKGHAECQRLAIADAALHATGLVGFCVDAAVADFKGIVVLRAGEERSGKSRSDLEALRRRKAEHGFGEIGFEAVEDRFAKADRHSTHGGIDQSADAVALAADFFDAGDHRFGGGGVGATDGIGFDGVEGHRVRIDAGFDVVDAGHPGKDFDVGKEGAEDFFRNGRSRHAANRLACGGAPTALPVANAVFRLVGEIGVRRAEMGFHFRVGFGAGVGVRHHDRDRCAERDTAKNPGEDFAGIRLLAWRDDIALPRTPPIKIRLNVLLGEW